MNSEDKALFDLAKIASESAYAPYSGYKVGAALKTASGKIYLGCNVENASYSLTICAERNAIFQAVAQGETKFSELAVFVQSDKLFPPCGACRQVISEFSDDIRIIYGNELTFAITNISKLLPESFSLV